MFFRRKCYENVIQQMMGGSTRYGLVVVILLSWISSSDNCKYPNLNMKFDIRKIVEREWPLNILLFVI